MKIFSNPVSVDFQLEEKERARLPLIESPQEAPGNHSFSPQLSIEGPGPAITRDAQLTPRRPPLNSKCVQYANRCMAHKALLVPLEGCCTLELVIEMTWRRLASALTQGCQIQHGALACLACPYPVMANHREADVSSPAAISATLSYRAASASVTL
ncbi:hypothetical protein DNTS_004906 [Danionella cerebrum]|uniref:Uncharacterized protein n=1 Tax=Danionella cerebrum TaxID=2873325 RepID=A0A553MZ84_9TELE|nr:hypothetical protein DNTS_004906 [Danionella translucida]